MAKAARDRFLAKTRVDDTGCRVWIGARDKDGYGQFKDRGKTHQAHVWIWIETHGPITEKDEEGRPYEVDHKCRRRECTNTYKDKDEPGGIGGCLELVTHAENMRRQREAQRRLKEKQKAEHAADLEERIKEAQKKTATLAKKYVKASPLKDSLRKQEAAIQLARTVVIAERWYALEQLGELEPEKSRQLGRIGSEIRKWLDELGIRSAEPDAPSGFLNYLE